MQYRVHHYCFSSLSICIQYNSVRIWKQVSSLEKVRLSIILFFFSFEGLQSILGYVMSLKTSLDWTPCTGDLQNVLMEYFCENNGDDDYPVVMRTLQVTIQQRLFQEHLWNVLGATLIDLMPTYIHSQKTFPSLLTTLGHVKSVLTYDCSDLTGELHPRCTVYSGARHPSD